MKLKIVAFFTLVIISAHIFAQKRFPYDTDVYAFRHQDSLNFPKPDGILFIGSSSIRVWTDLEQRFPGVPIIRRGVGGSELSQWVAYYTPYLLFPYHPRKIFIYAGENDIQADKSPQSVAHDFATLFGMIRAKMPEVKIYFMSIKQSPSRAKHYTDVITANDIIQRFLNDKINSYYIDVNAVLLNKAGLPDSSFFRPDYLHLNSKGYDRWEKALKHDVK